MFGGPCLMLVKPLVDGGEPRLFRVEVNVVGVMECTVELGKAGAAKIRTGDRCSLIGLRHARAPDPLAEAKTGWFSRPRATGPRTNSVACLSTCLGQRVRATPRQS